MEDPLRYEAGRGIMAGLVCEPVIHSGLPLQMPRLT